MIKPEDFQYSIKIDDLNFLSLLYKTFVFLCLPTLLTEVFIFLFIYLSFKMFGFLKTSTIFNAFFILLLFQLCFWVHEFAHIIVAYFLNGIEYIVKTPFKYKCFEICLGGGIFNKPEFKNESFVKKLMCQAAGLVANLISGLLFLLLYFYTNLVLFYIGFVMNISIFCISLLPLTVCGISFDGKNIAREIAHLIKKDVYIEIRRIKKRI